MQPKEHGSWAVFLVPLVAGLVGRGLEAVPTALFCAGALAAFLARPALLRKDYGVVAACLAIASAAFGALILGYGKLLLLAFGAPALIALAFDLQAQKERKGMSLANELRGVAGLCLIAPAAAYAARGEAGWRTGLLWLACAAFFTGPIFYVKMAALQHRAAGNPQALLPLEKARTNALIYHEAALLASGIAAVAGLIPPFTPAAFAVAFAKTLRRAGRPPEKVSFQSLGYQEVASSAFFLLCLL
jgi:hypothetical protein